MFAIIFCRLLILRKLHLYLQGDRANGMYFVESGTLVVLKRIDGDEKESVCTESGPPVFQGLLMNFLDTRAPVLGMTFS